MDAVIVISCARVHRELLAATLREHGVAVAMAARNVSDALKSIDRASAAIVDLPIPDGLETVRRLLLEGVPAIGINVPSDVEAVLAWASTGAVGCLGVEADVSAVVDAVREAIQWHPVCSPDLAACLFACGRISSEREGPQANAHLAILTRRERQVLILAAQDLTNKEIAQRLCVEVSTVKNHLRSAFRKASIHRRSEARLILSSTDRSPVAPRHL